jgi:hypothetical protein
LKKKLEGKKAPANKLAWQSFLREGAKLAEIYIGDKLGGPIGAIAGSMVGDYFNGKIDRRYGKTIFETKGMKAALNILKDTKPKIYNKIIEELKKHGVEIPEEPKKPASNAGLVKLVKKDVGELKFSASPSAQTKVQ